MTSKLAWIAIVLVGCGSGEATTECHFSPEHQPLNFPQIVRLDIDNLSDCPDEPDRGFKEIDTGIVRIYRNRMKGGMCIWRVCEAPMGVDWHEYCHCPEFTGTKSAAKIPDPDLATGVNRRPLGRPDTRTE